MFWFNIFLEICTVVSLFCNVVCGSLIDSNSQNISAISYLKNNIHMLVLGGRGCKLNAYIVYTGESGESKIIKLERTYLMDDPCAPVRMFIDV